MDFRKLITFSQLKSLILIVIISLITFSCSVPKFAKPSKVESSSPVNAKERARKNIEEGKGISLKGALGGSRSTNYEFNTSNPLWRASLEIIDFMPLATVDYSGGIIITDWYNHSVNENESIKITLRFMSNEIQSNSIKVIVHSKKCKTNENCKVNEIDSKLKFEIQKSILAKASQLEILAKEQKK
jgi:hypothetical protein